MAIPNTKYVDISSGVTSSAATSRRDLSGLVFTTRAAQSGYSGKSDFDNGTPLVVTGPDGATDAFGSDTPEAKFAASYFAFISKSATRAKRLTFVHYTGTPKDAFDALVKNYDDFGSFCFIPRIGKADAKAVAESNAGLNYRYLFCFSCALDPDDFDSSKTYEVGDVVIHETDIYVCKTAIATAAAWDASKWTVTGDASFNPDDFMDVAIKSVGSCAVFTRAAVEHPEYMPMALFATTDYSGTGTARVFMYQQFGTATVSLGCADGDADVIGYDYKLFDAAFLNYYGQTLKSGKNVAFFQDGYNLDGTDTAVYCNEVWFKDAIVTAILNLFIQMERVPANDLGAAIVRNVCAGVVSEALANGVISTQATLDAAQRETVNTLVGRSDAADEIEATGYILEARIVPASEASGGRITVKYLVVYTKGDSIRKVEGTHVLV